MAEGLVVLGIDIYELEAEAGALESPLRLAKRAEVDLAIFSLALRLVISIYSRLIIANS